MKTWDSGDCVPFCTLEHSIILGTKFGNKGFCSVTPIFWAIVSSVKWGKQCLSESMAVKIT